MSLIRSESGQYELADDGAYIVRDYLNAAPFSSFLPGIAGVWGIPLWAYYVNRGQGIACFGTQDKDHAIAPFESAKLHQHRVSQEGFRTLLALRAAGGERRFHEPFRRDTTAADLATEMVCRPHELEIREDNPEQGLTTRVVYTTLSNRPYAALVRCMTLTNTGTVPVDVELLDGAVRFLPYGTAFQLLQNLPFITEGYLQVHGLEANLPYATLKALASDSSETQQLQAGNFFFGLSSRDPSRPLPAFVDLERIFGPTGDLTYPNAFMAPRFSPFVRQNRHCQTCCAFCHDSVRLAPGESHSVVSLYGAAERREEVPDIAAQAACPDFVDRVRAETEREVRAVMDRFVLHGGAAELNLYARSTYLDNVLRGGLPVSLGTDERKQVFHLYSRKHGDLERDYNLFELSATPWSQGNGNFRDVNQNRRHDVWFNPDVGDGTVRLFFNLLQPDGFNPLVCRGVQFAIHDRQALLRVLGDAFDAGDVDTVAAHIANTFTPGDLFVFLRQQDIPLHMNGLAFLNRLVALAEKQELAEFETGYWTDHWVYNFDLLRSFEAVFPDRLRELLVGDPTFTYWDTDVRVLPRDDKYVLYDEGTVWHIDSIAADPQKRAQIDSRSERPHCVRTQNGQGDTYQTCLLQKILCLFVNKMATLSPSGLGMDMDAGRPGWHDSINGIPGALGASTSEIYHLIRAFDWTVNALDRCDLPADFALTVPIELHTFFGAVRDALAEYGSGDGDADFAYWDRTGMAKETYREATHAGFDGTETEVWIEELRGWLQAARSHLLRLSDRFADPSSKLPITYLTHRILDYEILSEPDPTTGQPVPKRHPRGYPCVRIKKVAPHCLPLFLEAPTHYLRTEPGADEARRVWNAVRASPLYDAPLGMYLVGDSVEEESKDVGRIWAWPPGWFENQNIFLHMEHKYLLALLHAGDHEKFFADLRHCLLPYQDMDRYARNPLENASFLVSSRHPRPDYHGRGFLPRTSGTTAEVLEMLLVMAFGKAPFRLEENALVLAFDPILPAWMFTQEASNCEFLQPDGTSRCEPVPANAFAALFLSRTLVVYRNPERKPTYGADPATVTGYEAVLSDGTVVSSEGPALPPDLAHAVRERRIPRLDITLA